MNTLDIPFKKQLEQLFPREEMANGTALLGTTKVFREGGYAWWNKAVDTFFNINTKIENVTTFGPEYRMAYWDHAGRYAPMLNTADLEKALEIAHKSLDGIKIMGKVIRKHPTIKLMEKNLLAVVKTMYMKQVLLYSNLIAWLERMLLSTLKICSMMLQSNYVLRKQFV